MLIRCIGRSTSSHLLKWCISTQMPGTQGTVLCESTKFGNLLKLKEFSPSLNMQFHSQVVDSTVDTLSGRSVQADSQVSDNLKLKRGLPRQRRRGHIRKMQEKQASFESRQADGSQEPDLEFPSDVSDHQEINSHAAKQNPANFAYRPKIDPSETSLILFPGQGSQFVGMGAKLLDYPNVINMFDTARHILGYDLLEVCLRGPKEVLQKTVVSQPAILVTSLAAVEKLKHDNPWAIEHCISTAGYDVGEISALVFTGAISFEDAIRLVKVRAESMQAASQLIPSGAITVYFNHDAKIGFACHAAKLYCLQKLGMSDAVCQITEYLYSGCKVIAGNQEALDFIARNAKEFGIQRLTRMPVSGAFHSRLMHSAIAPLSRSLAAIQLNKPAVPVHSNVTSRQHRPGAASISRHLLEQIWKPIMWEQTMHIMYSRPAGERFPSTFEMGPGRQLGAILRQINARAFEEYVSVEV